MGIEYDGSRYHGWQAQKKPKLPTLQETLEKALSFVANHTITIVCAGRTDAGVHAKEQVIHFDTESSRTDYSWQYGANSCLPKDISILWIKQVPKDFHARFSAQARAYRYIIHNHPIRPAILRAGLTWHYPKLDEDKMQQAAQCLLGEHDFSSFRAAQCQSKTPYRHVHSIHVYRQEKLVILDIEANAFLYHMVRNIAGVLMRVGEGVQPVEWVQEVLEKKDRRQAAVNAEPNGLYLTKVKYPDVYNLPTSVEGMAESLATMQSNPAYVEELEGIEQALNSSLPIEKEQWWKK